MIHGSGSWAWVVRVGETNKNVKIPIKARWMSFFNTVRLRNEMLTISLYIRL